MTHAVFYHPPIKNIPLTTAPLAFLHLATPIADGPHSLTLVDGRVEDDPVGALLDALSDAEVMLVSAMPGSQIATALDACAAARERYPELPIFWGGPHPSVAPESTISSPLVSGVLVGRGEFTINDILSHYADPVAASEIPNFIFKDRAGEIHRGPLVRFGRRPPNPPDFQLLSGVEPYVCQTRRSRRMIDYISSFGCPHRCTFCSEPITSGSLWSCMDAETLVNEIVKLKLLFGIDGILFQDAKFVTDKRRLVDFCMLLIDSDVSVNWMATICSTDIPAFERDGVLDLMQRSGCEQVFIGAEAAAAETLEQYRKSVEAEGTYRIAKLLWEQYDILPHFSYIIGYPMENMDQVTATLALRQSICELVGAPTGELGLYNPVEGSSYAAANAHHFRFPTSLEDWSDFSYSSQTLYANPSRELDQLLFRHNVKLRRMFPSMDHHKTYDIWQNQVPSL